MACQQWNDEWIASLYGELAPAEQDRLERHVAGCERCRDTLEGLHESRDLLRRAAPAVPAAPRLLAVPRASWRRRPLPAFAAGVVLTLIVFGGGLLAGGRWFPASPGVSGDPNRPVVTRDDVDAALATQRREFERELAAALAAHRPARTDDATTAAGVDGVTARELERAMASLERRIKLDRAADVEFLLQELQATEARAATWFDENREALMLVALQNDPRFTER